MKRVAALLLAVTFVMVSVAPAYACSGFIDCMFGFTDRTEIRNERMVEVERIEAQAQAEQARIEGEAAAALRQADAEVERIKQQRFVNEADRDIAIAQAQQQAEQYKAMIAGLTDEKLAGIQANADTQIMALQEATKIAVEGIVQTGQTERTRIVGGWSSVIVALILVGLIVLYWMRRYSAHMVVVSRQQPRRAISERQALPWYSDSIEIEEVGRNAIVTRR